MYNCKVTVLVAVYNAEAYLPKCLDSLCCQTLEDIEIMCIDDASTDNSPSILKDYTQRDARIKVITLPENRGQAYARNVGLRRATGRYVTLLDSDDWMDGDCLQKAVEVFEQYPDTGCVLFRVKFWKPEGFLKTYPMEGFEVMSGYDAFVASLTWKIHGWYMATAEIYKCHPFDESAHYFSDDNATRFHYIDSKEVRTCDGVFNYLLLPQSVSRQITVRRFDYLIANTSMKRQLDGMNLDKSVVDLYENHRWLNVIDLYMFYYKYRKALSSADAGEGLAVIRQTWETIEVKRLSVRNRWKFGYMPLRGHWFLFRLQEELYFTLRRILGR